MTREGLRAALALEKAGDERPLPDGAMDAVSDKEIDGILDELRAYRGPIDMPPDTRHMRLLIDAAGHLNGARTRAGGWSVIGVLSKDGRGYLGRRRGRITWAVFYTAMAYGLGRDAHASSECHGPRAREPALT